jgi:hypothetical protein
VDAGGPAAYAAAPGADLTARPPEDRADARRPGYHRGAILIARARSEGVMACWPEDREIWVIGLNCRCATTGS